MKTRPIQWILLTLWLAVFPGGLHALTATSFFPVNNATNVCADTPLKITFDTAPTIGTSGAVRIYSAAGTLVDTLDLAVAHTRTIGGTLYNAHPVLVSGTTASIFPRSGVLAYNTTYYVTIDATVLPGYAGITANTTWRFTTKSAAPSSSGTYFTVAADGTADFCTVQGAIDLIPANNLTKRYINIRNGTYQEIVRVSSKHNLAFRGQNRKRTVIAYPNNSNLNASTNTRPLFNVAANDISFDNLTLHNTTADGGSQAEALRVNAQRCVVNNCDLRSYQDTFLVNSAADTAYFKDSLIEGDADFIWGTGRAVFQSCEIKSLSGGYVCAMRNPAGQYGAVFLDCRFTRSPGVTGVVFGRVDPNTFPDSAVAVVNCAVDAHITAAGWTLSNPGPTTGLRYWEYQSTDLTGAPLNVSSRASFSQQINSTQATALRNLATTFGGWTPIPPLPAFPGAEGAGANTLGGRGGDLYFVTNLNDSGAGSLRDAISTAPASGRTILFRTSGTIPLNSTLTVNKPRITIAGQSAPGGGICLKNYTLRAGANDVVIRHLRSRLGTDANREDDAITVTAGINVMVDHCSASWSVDEVLSVTNAADNVTVQWSMISEALDNSIHSKGPHGFGSLLACHVPARYSFHHNLYAHNKSRNPRTGSDFGAILNFDFRNNVIYNWGYFCGYSGGADEDVEMNHVANYMVKGPGSTTDSAFRGGAATTLIHQSGNRIDLNKNAAFDGTDTGWSMFSGTYTQRTTAFDFAQTNTTDSANLALQRVLSKAGARPWSRDTKDAAIAANVSAGTGTFVNTPADAGGYPVLTATPAPADSDNDGMPDDWESAVGSDPFVANHNADADADGYTDLEEYLNWLAGPHAFTQKNNAVLIDLQQLNGHRTGLAYTLSNPLNGTVALAPDGRTATFTPTAGFQGLGAFAFSFTALGETVSQTVGVAVTAGPPREVSWSGATNGTWDIAGTANFHDGTAATPFAQGDRVRFLQTGANPTITLSGSPAPSLMTVDATKDYSFGGTGSLTGSMSLAKSGSGKLTLSTANSFTGGVTVTGGTLALTHASAAGSGPIQIHQATLDIAGLNLVNPVAFTGTSQLAGLAFCKLKAVSGDGTVNVSIGSSPFDLTGNMADFSGALVLATNTNIRLLTGTTGSGLATFDLGTGTGNITVRNNLPAIALGALKGGPNTLLLGQSNDNLPTTFTLGGNDQDCTFSGGIRNGTSGASAITSVTKTGAGTFTLAGTSNYTGATLVNEGTLRVTGTLGATNVTVANGAYLAGSGSIGGSVNVQTGGSISSGSGGAGTLAITGSLTLNGTALTFDLSNSNTPGGGINDLYSIGGALVLNGTITVTPNLLNGPLAAGTYTLISGGSSTVNNATLVWGGTPNGGRQNVVFDTSVPGTLKLIVTGTPSASLLWNGTPGSTWDSGDPVNPAIGAANWRNGVSPDRFVKYDAVTFDDTLTNGTAVLSGNVEPSSVTVNNPTKAVTLNAGAGSIIGGTSLTKSGAGTLTISGNNTYSGGTVVSGGTLAITSASALGTGAVSFHNAAFNIGALKPANTLSFSGTNTVTGGSTGGLAGIASLTGDGLVNLHIDTGVFDLTGDLGSFTGTLRIATNQSVRLVGSSGGNGMTLDLGTGSGNLYNRSGIAAASFGALQGGPSTVLRGASNNNTLTTYTVGAKNLDTVFDGSIQNGTGGASALTALVKTGTGRLTMSGANTHTGPTTVNGGALHVTGSVGTSAVTVSEGALLSGTGNLAATTIQGDATLSPGDGGPGVLTFTNGLTLAADSVTAFDLGTTRDRVDVTGNLSLNGIINFTNAGGLLPGTYTIFNYTGTLVGGLSVGTVPADFGCTLDTTTPGQVKAVVTTTLSAFQQWQILWFGGTGSPDADPGADPDLDGQTNNDEFLAGTDPTSATSVSTLVWRGDGSTNLWNTGSAVTFWNGARLSTFTNGNPVLFDATGAANPTVNLSGTLSPVSVAVINTSAFTFTGPGALTGTAALTKSGTGTLNLQTPNSHTGGTVINGGTFNLTGNQSGATGGYQMNVVNSATSTLNLGSASQAAATTAVTALSKTVQLGAIPGVNTAVGTSAQTLNVNGAAAFPTTVTNNGSLAVARNATLNLGDHSNWTQAGAINVQANGGYAATLNIGTAAGSSAVMTHTGSSPIQLSQTTGTSSLSTLTIRGLLTTGRPVQFNGASGNANGYGRLILTGGGTVRLSASIPQLVTGDASGRFILSNNGGGIIDTNGFSTTIDRPLADSNPVNFIGSLTKIGAGTLTLSNTSTYSGNTAVTGGTLMVNGSIATSTTAVETSGTLGGTGTAGPVTVKSGGTLAPGVENVGTLTTGPLTLESGSHANFQLGSTSNRVDVIGNLTLGGTVVITETGSVLSGGYTILTYTGSLSGTASVTPPPGFAAELDTTTPGMVKVTLRANLYGTWTRDHFTSAELADPSISGPDATPANDGLTNLLKYALGLPPKTPSTTGITIAREGGSWFLIYQRPAGRADLAYVAEASTRLDNASWSGNGVTHERVSTGDPESWRAGFPGFAGERLFLRLKVLRE
jgi:autotransporter-associated beta strand protein